MHRPLIIACVSLLLFASTVSAATWRVNVDGTGDAPTIQAAIDGADDGDLILLAPGVYNWVNQGGGSEYGLITMLRGVAAVTVRSEAGPEQTILDGQLVGRIWFFQGGTSLTIDGLTFRNGAAPVIGDYNGGAFAAHLASPIIQNCIFKNNSAQQGGAYWYGGYGAPKILNCKFVYNDASTVGGAILIVNTPLTIEIADCVIQYNTGGRGGGIGAYNVSVLIDNCVITDNVADGNGGGLEMNALNSPATIRSTTLHANMAGGSGSGVAVIGSGHVDIEHTIIAQGECNAGPVYASTTGTAAISCCDVYSNAPGNFMGAIAGMNGVDGNFSQNPLFCVEPSDLHLRADSPCADGNHPSGGGCGLIGARDVQCGVSPVEDTTWGGIKALYQ